MRTSIKKTMVATLAMACLACAGVGAVASVDVTAKAEDSTGKTVYVNGTDLHRTEQEGATAVALNLVTEYGASVRYNADSTGIRFTTHIAQSEYDALGEAKTSVSFGTLIAPYDLLGEGTALTHELDEANYVDIEQTENSWYRKKIGETIYYCFNGALTDIYTNNYDRDFIGIGYMKLTYSDATTEYVYATTSAKETGDTQESNVRNVKAISEKLLTADAGAEEKDKLTTDQKAVLNTFTHDATLKSNGTEAKLFVGKRYAGKTVTLDVKLTSDAADYDVTTEGDYTFVSGGAETKTNLEYVKGLNNTSAKLENVQVDEDGYACVKLTTPEDAANFNVFVNKGIVTETGDNAVKMDLSKLTSGGKKGMLNSEYYGDVLDYVRPSESVGNSWNTGIDLDFSNAKSQTDIYSAVRVTFKCTNAKGWFIAEKSNKTKLFLGAVDNAAYNTTTSNYSATSAGRYYFDSDGKVVTSTEAGKWYTVIFNDGFKTLVSSNEKSPGSLQFYCAQGEGSAIQIAEIAICENIVVPDVDLSTMTAAGKNASVTYENGILTYTKLDGYQAYNDRLTGSFSSWVDRTTNKAVKITFRATADTVSRSGQTGYRFNSWVNGTLKETNFGVGKNLANSSYGTREGVYLFKEDGTLIEDVSTIQDSQWVTVILNDHLATDFYMYSNAGNIEIKSISACQNYVPATTEDAE